MRRNQDIFNENDNPNLNDNFNFNDNANLNDNQNAPAYNLAGQRVNAQTAKGIIIKNGRKYVK